MPKASPKTDLPPAEPASYELALEELEQLVGRIESGQMPLDQNAGGLPAGRHLCWRFAASGSMLCKTRSRCWTKAVCNRGTRMSAAMTPAALTAWDLNGWSKHHLGRVEDALSRWVGDGPGRSGRCHALRRSGWWQAPAPLLVLAAYEAALSAQSTAIGCDAAPWRCQPETALRARRARWS